MTGIKASDPKFKARCAEAVEKTDLQLAQLSAAWDAGDSLQVKKIVSELLEGRDIKFRAAVEIMKEKGEKLKPKPTASRCYSVANTLSFFEKPNEHVEMFIREKADGSSRPVLNFGFRYRVAQRALVLVLSAIHRPQKFQYVHRGCKDAVLRAAQLIGDGNHFYAHLDIMKFYPSFTLSELGQESALGGVLSPQTLDIFVIGRRLSIGKNASDNDKSKLLGDHFTSSSTLMKREARRGIPTGSMLSSLIAPMMVSRMKLSQEVQDHLVNYEDNFLLVASSEQELDAMVKELEAAVKGIPGGQFKLAEKGTGKVDADDSANFLGHAIYVEKKKARISVSPANHERFYERLEQLDWNMPTHEELKKMGYEKFKLIKEQSWAASLQYIRAWKNAYSLCDRAEAMACIAREKILAEIEGAGLKPNMFINKKTDSYFDFKEHFEFSGMS